MALTPFPSSVLDNIVKIDSVTQSFCLRHYVQNGLSYLAEETRPMLCKPTPSGTQLGIRSKRTNKHQLLHRIASVKTPLIYNNKTRFENLQPFDLASSLLTTKPDCRPWVRFIYCPSCLNKLINVVYVVNAPVCTELEFSNNFLQEKTQLF